jgi:hypothetical protein
MDSTDQEKMLRRRERAAAWAAGRSESDSNAGGFSEQPSSSSRSVEIRTNSSNVSGSDSNPASDAGPRNWSGWARHVSGDSAGPSTWRNTVGGLQAVSESYGRHNSAALKQVAYFP